MEFFAKIAHAFNEGGFWMYAIMLVQIVSLAIMAERVYALFFKRKANQLDFIRQVEDPIRRGEIEVVLNKARAESEKYPIAQVAVAGAQAAANFGGKDEIQGKMDEVLLHHNASMERRIGFLAMLGNVATLVGLLGTITGMIKSFAAVSFANPAEKAALLAAGIAEAMNATAYGLITAIPALIAYAILSNRATVLAEDLNQNALKVFNWLSFAFDPVSLRNSVKMNANGKNNEGREINL
ncbi:MAG: MotA/TolQ/ExbB proton channel family protein [Bdellovibrionaceae bacterium]|nr:MotA/TolQ/ExbB proton channel family protein [Pseudobdellovibrionaceae bacterium]